MKIIYKPFGLILSMVAGMLAGTLSKRIWRAFAGEATSPAALDRDRGWEEIVLAAAVQGAVFGAVKAAVDRAGATGFARVTGTWPGPSEEE